MGNNQTQILRQDKHTTDKSNASNISNNSLLNTLHTIAAEFVYNQDFINLQKLTNAEYCRELTLLTSDILQDSFEELNIPNTFKLIHHDEYGNENEKKNKDTNPYLKSQKTTFFSFTQQTPSPDMSQKRKMCNYIAKFYIKLAHLFSAIVTTINPVYEINSGGYKTQLTFENVYKMKVSPKNLTQNTLGLCYRRLYSTLSDYSKYMGTIGENPDEISLQSNFCSLNNKIKMDRSSGSKIERTENKNLFDESGIPELKQLYMDEFNTETGAFDSMSDVSKRQYKQDLELFYKAFTGNNEMPDSIQEFSDIPLRDFSLLSGCKQGEYTQNITVNTKDALYIEYGRLMKIMLQNIIQQQQQLKQILDFIFIHIDGKLSVNPKLTMNILNEFIEKVREIIVELYLNCEMNFIQITKVFQALVESNKQVVLERQERNLHDLRNGLIVE
jgi:hypothetical protein